MITLGIDTTAVAVSAALMEDGKLLCEFYTNIGLQHSRTLMPMIDALLTCCHVSPQDIQRFGVNTGPGSFTGVRIGVAAVKGMAFANNTPCVAVSTLESLAYNLPPSDHLICPVMDARAGQVYNGLFQWKDGCLQRLCQDRAITISQLQQELKEINRQVMWLGDGAKLCFNALTDPSGHSIPPESLLYQRASSVAQLAEQSQTVVKPHLLEVSYLRPPQAVRAKAEQNKCKDDEK